MQNKDEYKSTRVARTLASDSNVHFFHAESGVELTLAIIGDVVSAADRLLVTTVADRFQTLSEVKVAAHTALEVFSTSTVHAI